MTVADFVYIADVLKKNLEEKRKGKSLNANDLKSLSEFFEAEEAYYSFNNLKITFKGE